MYCINESTKPEELHKDTRGTQTEEAGQADPPAIAKIEDQARQSVVETERMHYGLNLNFQKRMKIPKKTGD